METWERQILSVFYQLSSGSLFSQWKNCFLLKIIYKSHSLAEQRTYQVFLQNSGQTCEVLRAVTLLHLNNGHLDNNFSFSVAISLKKQYFQEAPSLSQNTTMCQQVFSPLLPPPAPGKTLPGSWNTRELLHFTAHTVLRTELSSHGSKEDKHSLSNSPFHRAKWVSFLSCGVKRELTVQTELF